MYIKYSKLSKDAITPTRTNPSDAGIDVYCCADHKIFIDAGETKTISTGLSFEIPHGYVMLVMDRSSISSRVGLKTGGGVIDPGYSGEIKLIMHNFTNSTAIIEPGQKIAQLLVIPVAHCGLLEVPKDNIYENEVAISKRGKKGFGSSDS